jgi:hypothetical protein
VDDPAPLPTHPVAPLFRLRKLYQPEYHFADWLKSRPTLRQEIDCAFPSPQGYNRGQDHLLLLLGGNPRALGFIHQENATV